MKTDFKRFSRFSSALTSIGMVVSATLAIAVAVTSGEPAAQALGLPAPVAFDFLANFQRYPAPDDYFRILAASFPLAGGPALDAFHCRAGDDATKLILGESQPATGQPLFQNPGSPFIEWWAKCLRVSVESDVSGAFVVPGQIQRYIPSSVKNDLTGFQSDIARSKGRKLKLRELPWNQLGPQTKLAIAENIFAHLGLHGLIDNEESAISDIIQKIETAHPNMSLRSALIEITFNFGMQNYFLVRQ